MHQLQGETTMRRIVTSLAVLTLAAGGAIGQDPNAAQKGGQQGLSIQAPGVDIQIGGGANQEKDAPMTDREFVLRASGRGMAEVQAAQLAQRKATAEEIRTFARQMIADHTRANEELNKLARSKELPVAAEPNEKDKEALERLRNAQATDFDRMYASQQVRAHQDVVALFERASRVVPDTDLKDWAGKTLPTLKQHLAMARRLTDGDRRDPAATTTSAPAGVTDPVDPTTRPIR
jgi:putative membrane protein